MTVQELKEAVKKLSWQERILFAQYILELLMNEDEGEIASHLSDEWQKELELLQKGKFKLVLGMRSKKD